MKPLVKEEVAWYFRNMQKGALVVHGLTGSPANLQPITDKLKENGFIVQAPLLPGHTALQHLVKSKWSDWYGEVFRSFEELSQKCDEVYFVGLSMGALLGLKLAGGVGPKLKALALLGVPFQVRPFYRFFMIPVIRYTPLRWIIRSVDKNFEKSVLDPIGRKMYFDNSLKRMPGMAAFQTQNLARHLYKEAHKVTQPLLLIHGVKDHIADPIGLKKLENLVASQKIEKILMGNSGHVVTMDYDREIVAERVVQFFDSCK
ncbi:MAG: alpha/beta fold hydrolase [Deltaproteobacteria bacterium]|nr:alpha/beta fold hydrolase [Deltaproteobacteria bacterium]